MGPQPNELLDALRHQSDPTLARCDLLGCSDVHNHGIMTHMTMGRRAVLPFGTPLPDPILADPTPSQNDDSRRGYRDLSRL